MSNEECLYNVNFICRRPHFKSNTEAAVSIFNIYKLYEKSGCQYFYNFFFMKHDEIPSISKILQKKICTTVFKCLKGNLPMVQHYFELVSHDNETLNNNTIFRVP